MSAEVWSIIAAGIVILIAIATSNRALRREMTERIDRLDRRIDELGERISAVEKWLLEHLGDVRERLSRVEGLLEGLWAAERGRRERSGDVHGTQRTTGLP